jgi:hypothetical protein
MFPDSAFSGLHGLLYKPLSRMAAFLFRIGISPDSYFTFCFSCIVGIVASENILDKPGGARTLFALYQDGICFSFFSCC